MVGGNTSVVSLQSSAHLFPYRLERKEALYPLCWTNILVCLVHVRLQPIMATPKFSIPAEFQPELRFRPSPDTRPDAEILATLTTHVPITSEKNIWAFWHAGVASMPAWCQRNIINWIRLCGPSGWTVRILDSVPHSPNNALTFLPPEMLPKSFVEGRMDGPYVGPHSADFLRGACLWLFGGVYMDVGIVLIRGLDEICWGQLEDEGSPFRVSIPWMYGAVTANHFVAARKGDPFIKRW